MSALETGKEDAGTAAAEVAAHDASATAHGSVEASFAAHEGAGGVARHPVAVAGVGGEGFVPALSGSGVTYLSGSGTWSVPQVVSDTDPVLGGDLETKGNEIILTRADNTVHGALLAEETLGGAALYYTDTAGAYDTLNGAIQVGAGHVTLFGSVARVDSLRHVETARQQVYADQDGGLYAVEEPPPGWTADDTDAADYDLGAPGTGTGVWVDMTGLAVVTGGDLATGERVDIAVTLSIANKSSNRSGLVEIYYGVAGNTPGAGDVDDTAPVSPGFVGQLTLGGVELSGADYTSGTDITIWARAAGGSGVGYGLDLLGSIIAPHRLIVSVAGTGGGGSGEINTSSTPATVGANEADLNMLKSGFDLPKRKLVGGANVTLTQGADSITIAATGGSSSGDMVAPGTMGAGFLYESTADGTGEQTADSGVATANVALLDGANVFSATQTVSSATAATLALTDTGATADYNTFNVVVDGGALDIEAPFLTGQTTYLRIGTPSGGPQEGGLAFGVGANLGAPGTITASAGLFDGTDEVLSTKSSAAMLAGAGLAGNTRSFAASYNGVAPNPSGGHYWESGGTAFTVSGVQTEVGVTTGYIPAGTSCTLNGYTEVGTQPAGAAHLVLERVSTANAFGTATWIG